MQPLGMIAGAGEFPQFVAQQACREGRLLPTVALSAQIARLLAPYCPIITHCSLGQLGKLLRALRHYAVREVIVVGKVQKELLWHTPRLDLRTLRLLSQVRDYQDTTLWQAFVAELAREGIAVVEQTRLLAHLLTPEGVLTTRSPSRREWADIRYGFAQAKRLVALDIGQTVVVRRGTVLAVEAVEGTDATIRRGCAYGRRGTTVVKVGRHPPDMRFDVPAIGPHTVHEVIAGGATVLAVEAGTTFTLRLPEVVEAADAHGVALIGVSSRLLQQYEG